MFVLKVGAYKKEKDTQPKILYINLHILTMWLTFTKLLILKMKNAMAINNYDDDDDDEEEEEERCKFLSKQDWGILNGTAPTTSSCS